MPNDLRDWTSAAGAPQRGLATFTASPNATTPQTVSISRGTHSVAVLLNSLTNVNSISVTGVQTGVIYAANLLTLTAFGTLFFIPVLSDFDNQITVAVTMGIGAQTATVRVAEILDPEIVSIFQSNTLVVQGTGISAAVNTDPIDRAARQLGRVVLVDTANNALLGIGGGGGPLQVQLTSPQLWQVPNNFVAIDVGAGLAINGTVTLVAGLANQVIRLFGWHLETDASSSIGIASLEDSTTAVIDKTPLSFVPLGLFVDFKGLPLVSGRGLVLANRGSAATSALRGSLTFTQG